MSETFPVRAAEGTALVAPDGAQLVFHGINKSGSFAMSSAMRDAYALAGRDDQFLCHYFIGGSRESFAERVDSAEGPGFFVGHYLYGALKPRPNRVWVTIFRHPLPRMLSCYNWLKNKHERQEAEESPLGLILCAEAGAEQVELLNMQKDNIMVAEYWTSLPPKELLEEKLHNALIEARERLAERKSLEEDDFII